MQLLPAEQENIELFCLKRIGRSGRVDCSTQDGKLRSLRPQRKEGKDSILSLGISYGILVIKDLEFLNTDLKYIQIL